MFGRLMNSYYYGKSGKGDFRKEDLPENRWQLFWDTLRTRLSALFRLNLLYMLIFLPTMIVIGMNCLNLLSNVNLIAAAQEGRLNEAVQAMQEEGQTAPTVTAEQEAELAAVDAGAMVDSWAVRLLLILIPCIGITGPFTAGLSYVTRNWARDEHAFIWSDFKDAAKENWKAALGLSLITGLFPALVYVGWRFYGQMAKTQILMAVPQVLVVALGVIWAISITYMHPLQVTYKLRFRDVIRNGLLMGVARLPMSVGIRLLHCVPIAVGIALALLWHPIYALLLTGMYYMLIGFSLSRFITAHYTNAMFDRYLNPRIEGAEVNRGLRQKTDEDDEDDEEEGTEA